MTLPAEIVEAIDRRETNRSRFVLEAVSHELERRRREELRRSLQNPHAETSELADMGLDEWFETLPEDAQDLVDPSGGTPVRWVPGQGWIEGDA